MYTFPPEVWDALVDEFDLHTDYSGRGMFGARCIGLIGQAGDLLRFAAACQRTADELDLPGEELVDALAGTVRSDNMGYDLIFYFPGVELGTDSNGHHTTQPTHDPAHPTPPRPGPAAQTGRRPSRTEDTCDDPHR